MNETEQYLFWLLISVAAFVAGAFGAQLFFWQRDRISDWMETTVMPSKLGRLRPIQWLSNRLLSDMGQRAIDVKGQMYVDYGWIAKTDNGGFRPFFDLAHAFLVLMNEGFYDVEFTAGWMAQIRLNLWLANEMQTEVRQEVTDNILDGEEDLDKRIEGIRQQVYDPKNHWNR